MLAGECIRAFSRNIFIPDKLKIYIFAMMLLHSLVVFVCSLSVAVARDIVFPPVSGYVPQDASIGQVPIADLHPWGPNDVPGGPSGRFAGLQTFANLPYVFCLKDLNEDPVEPLGEDEKFDIAFLGAPFDTVRA